MLKDVLYIDNSPLDLFIVDHFQKKYHCFNSLTVTTDALTALADLKLHADDVDALPDIIFLDLYMPTFNGYQFLTQFEKIYPMFKKQIWVHILTSSLSPTDIARCKSFPHVKMYHVKPITMQDLLTAEDLH
jgi:CheY-like chemotaxis protein